MTKTCLFKITAHSPPPLAAQASTMHPITKRQKCFCPTDYPNDSDNLNHLRILDTAVQGKSGHVKLQLIQRCPRSLGAATQSKLSKSEMSRFELDSGEKPLTIAGARMKRFTSHRTPIVTLLVAFAVVGCSAKSSTQISIEGSAEQYDLFEGSTPLLVNWDEVPEWLTEENRNPIEWKATAITLDLTDAPNDCNIDLRADLDGDGDSDYSGDFGSPEIKAGAVPSYSLSGTASITATGNCTGATITIE